MFTNNEKFGGNFENPLSDLIANANHLEIITGYIGLSVIRNYFDDLVKISKSGQCRIVIGMAYKEGLEPFKLKLLSDLDEKLRTSGSKNAANQEATKQSKTVIERLEHIKPGENAWTASLPEHLKLNVKGAKMSMIYKRLNPDKPSYTVTGSGGGGTHIYHWDEPRALTNRERAR